ncbi:hypothetical protein J6Z48_01690 [bacterium]|nr:hypothetical protein [bacterium]
MKSNNFVKVAFVLVVFVCALACFFIKVGIPNDSTTQFVKEVSAATDNHLPWFATKGADVYGGDVVVNNQKDLSDSSINEEMYLRRDSTYTILSYNMRDSEDRGKISTFTGLLSIARDGGSFLANNDRFVTSSSTLAINAADTMRKTNTFYDHFMLTISKRLSGLEELSDLNSIGVCTGNCIFRSKDNIEIESGLNCSAPVLIVSEKDIIINPDVMVTGGNNGCIFLAKENIIIKEGMNKTDKSLGVIDYDRIYGYLLADGQIIIEEDANDDGLEVIGGMVALASDGLEGCSKYDEYNKYGGCKAAVAIFRNVGASNYEYNKTNPSLVVAYDQRYKKIASYFFGLQSYYYKTDIGLKL